MCFINLLKESAVSSLERGSTAYLTPLVRYISSISSCHVHLHWILTPLKDPWHGQGSHLEVTGQHWLQRVIHHSCHQPADPAPAWTPRRAMEAASTAVEGFFFLQLSLQRASSPPFLFLFISWSPPLSFYWVLCFSYVRPGKIHISSTFRWNNGDQSLLSL